jgi:glycosyltransferase involved in cell wall biosynthesis
MTALIGIVISTLNAERDFQACLDSIFDQSSSEWEVVVIDGGSTDSTVDIIRRNQQRLAFWVSERDSGIYDAWNKAIPHLAAPWVLFLGADDRLYASDTLDRVTPVLRNARNTCNIVYGKVEVIDAAGRHLEYLGEPWEKIEKRFRSEMCLPHQGVFHRRTLLEKGFDSRFRFAGDYFMLLSEVMKAPPLFCDLVVSCWRQGGVSSRPELSAAVWREFREAQWRCGITRAIPGWGEIKARVKDVLFTILSRQGAWRILNLYRVLSGRSMRPY